ncbi:bactofilin family protein [Thiosulfativibrio zosterae]|uniref:Cell shape determination protein CcmA n=1 Tax=Thiosulfativibrio zosterae TaxID=2675053 RepID=A0A6F8PPN8_9GAMM|nr:polymer-forming cytoskeletal protein [Thiosulfativibrio zosterae]BBP43960.1 hypothetical protein THMIRHAT_17060 [Thiosulfativibrio zosterae]
MGIFNSKSARTRQEGGKTIIAQGCRISGELADLKGTLHVDGFIEGTVSTEFDISVGETGVVNGLIKAENIVVSGILEGKVTCKSIDILSTGKVMGEVICGALMIEAGGKFIGESRELTDGAMIVSLAEAERLSDSRVAKLVDANIDEAPEDFQNKKASGSK